MSNRIQMTEEQARELFSHVCIDISDFPKDKNTDNIFMMNQTIRELKRYGYIIKSELQQKVEEAEQLWQEMKSNGWNFTPFEQNMYNIIQLLKQSHPEFKK